MTPERRALPDRDSYQAPRTSGPVGDTVCPTGETSSRPTKADLLGPVRHPEDRLHWLFEVGAGIARNQTRWGLVHQVTGVPPHGRCLSISGGVSIASRNSPARRSGPVQPVVRHRCRTVIRVNSRFGASAGVVRSASRRSHRIGQRDENLARVLGSKSATDRPMAVRLGRVAFPDGVSARAARRAALRPNVDAADRPVVRGGVDEFRCTAVRVATPASQYVPRTC
jgi:hypothetical protein